MNEDRKAFIQPLRAQMRTDMIPAFPPRMLPLSCIDRILLKTPLSQILHHIYVVARKRC